MSSDGESDEAWRMDNEAETKRYFTKLSDIEDLNTFPENGSSNEEWLRWFREKQLQEIKRLQSIKEEEERKRYQREEKTIKGAMAYEQWLQRVTKEEQKKKKQLAELEKKKKADEEEQKKRKEEAKNVRAVKSKETFENWSQKAKSRPKPLPVALSVYVVLPTSADETNRKTESTAGNRNPYVGRIQCNPNEWQN